MVDEVFKYLSEHYPLIFLLLCVIAITWYLNNKYHHWSDRVIKAEDECKKIEGHLNPQLVAINTSLNTLNGNFNSLVVYLKGKDGKMDASLFVSKSPIQLTELGKRVLEAIGGREFIDKYSDTLIQAMNLQGIKTALDSQTYAPIVITQVSSLESFNKIKDYAYKNPYYKETNEEGKEISVPLDMGTITNIMGIYLRDKYLQVNPHLNPEDIPSAVKA